MTIDRRVPLIEELDETGSSYCREACTVGDLPDVSARRDALASLTAGLGVECLPFGMA